MKDTQKTVMDALDQFVDKVLAYTPKKTRQKNIKQATPAGAAPSSQKKEV